MKSTISITVTLGDDRQPEKITWEADDSNQNAKQIRDSKAMLLSFFDEATLDTFKIDLWTKEMQISEMDRLVYNTLKGLSETYFKATRNDELSNQFRSFATHFGKATGILNTDNKS